MSEAKHAPGPWRAQIVGVGRRDRNVLIFGDAAVGLVAHTPIRELPAEESRCDVDQANACLIAAAPDLLAALRDAAATLTEAANCLRPKLPSLADNIVEACATRARAAIARAERRS